MIFLIEISGYKNEAEQYASDHGMEITFEGNGDKGEAYLTDKNTIIKVTSDNTEIEFAKKI